MLKLINNPSKPSLLSLVQKSILRPSTSLSYGYGTEWEDDYAGMGAYHDIYGGGYNDFSSGWDEDDVVVPIRSKGVKPVTRRSGSKHKKRLDIIKDEYSSWSRNKRLMGRFTGIDEDDVSDDNDKIIYYYNDPTINNDVQEFKSLHEFSEFLDSEGIQVSDVEISNLTYRTVSHCCINPLDVQSLGELNLVSEHSYGALYYTCCEPCD